ncbi:MAG: NUDIX domain-containing protein [Myxococcales bacterium]|nr:NUDIX domain-containing protein [Myxococcales bacterium]
MLLADDPRSRVLLRLAAHAPADEAEARDVAAISAFVRANADCFGKANPVAHLTGSAFVLAPDGRLLLHHHRKLDRWLQLGGHTDPGEVDVADTAFREAAEESGLTDLRFHPALGRRPIDVDAHRIPARPGEAAHDHLDLRYVLVTDTPEAIECSAESRALAWFHGAALAALGFDPALRRAVDKLRTLSEAPRLA